MLLEWRLIMFIILAKRITSTARTSRGRLKEPIISRMTLDCQTPVNIMFADTKDFDGIVYGHMIIELPTDENQAAKVMSWLKNSPVKWKEEA